MDRTLTNSIRKDLDNKLVLLAGPRQVGKTTLSKSLFEKMESLNFDAVKDRKIIAAQEWNRETELLIFDELHKMRKWKSWVKGVFDTEGTRPRILREIRSIEILIELLSERVRMVF